MGYEYSVWTSQTLQLWDTSASFLYTFLSLRHSVIATEKNIKSFSWTRKKDGVEEKGCRGKGVEEGVWRKGCEGRGLRSRGSSASLPSLTALTRPLPERWSGKQTQVPMPKHSSHPRGNERGLYSGAKYEGPGPRNTDSVYPKFHLPMVTISWIWFFFP